MQGWCRSLPLLEIRDSPAGLRLDGSGLGWAQGDEVDGRGASSHHARPQGLGFV